MRQHAIVGLHDSRCRKVEIPLILKMLLQLLTKAWTAGLLNGLGDAVSQKFVEKNDDLDFKRLGIFTLLVCYTSMLYFVSIWMALRHRSSVKKAPVAICSVSDGLHSQMLLQAFQPHCCFAYNSFWGIVSVLMQHLIFSASSTDNISLQS